MSTIVKKALGLALLSTFASAYAPSAMASSHREAPFISQNPKVDGTDFYMFRSYEPGRSAFTTLIANYVPLQDAYAGPNYFEMDPNALYEIHIDNNGDAKEDLTFQFRFTNTNKDSQLTVGGKQVSIPLVINGGAIASVNAPGTNVRETYAVTVVRGDRRTGTRSAVVNADSGSATFDKPIDNVGNKSIPNYAAYAAAHIYNITIPGCATPAKMFVGQRKDPFVVNLGETFDLINIKAPATEFAANAESAAKDDLALKNITSIELEVATSCLMATGSTDPVIGGWTTASMRQGRLLNPTPNTSTASKEGGAWTQVSRLGMPLVNELVIGMKDKDLFNSSKPSGDGQFLTYVTNPSYPKLLETYLGAAGISPTNIPRNDLVTTFLTGITGLNQLATVTPSEMLRLNTSKPAVAFADQNRLGYVGNALAGGSDFACYPNGRRPKDDVVDITLIAAMGGLCVANGTTDAFGFGAACNPSAVPMGATAFNLNDTVDQAAQPFLPGFPYLNTPIPGTGTRAEAVPAPAALAAKRGNGSK